MHIQCILRFNIRYAHTHVETQHVKYYYGNNCLGNIAYSRQSQMRALAQTLTDWLRRRYKNAHEIICHHQSAHFVVCSTGMILYTIHSCQPLLIHLRKISTIVIQLIITQVLLHALHIEHCSKNKLNV